MRKLLFLLLFSISMPIMAVVGRVKLIDSPSGCKYIDTQVNGVKVRFMLDTGCSDVMITPQVWYMLKKAGKVTDSELSASTSSKMADGRSQQGYDFIIKELRIGNFVFSNIRADVVNSSEAEDCLLGQSLLGQFEYYKISSNTMEFSYNENSLYRIADDSNSAPAAVADALRPMYMAGTLNMAYQIKYAEALYSSKQYSEAVEAYQLLMDTTGYAVKPEVRDAWLYAQLGVANQLVENEQYDEAINYCRTKINDITLRADSVGRKVVLGLEYTVFISYLFKEEISLAAIYGTQYVDQKLKESHGISTHDLERRRIKCKDDMVRNVLDNLRIAYNNKRDYKRSLYYERLLHNAGF